MMRVVRERPRVAAATALGAVALATLCGALGALIAGQPSTVSKATELRLASAENAARGHARLLGAARAQLNESRTAAQRLERRVLALRRRNAALRRALEKVRRPGGREPRRGRARSREKAGRL